MLRHVYLIAAAAALLVFGALLLGGARYAEWQEERYARTLAPAEFSQKDLGSALQRAAFRQRDLLPVYGSSELNLQKPYQQPYRAINLFRAEPTGFEIFPIGQGDTTDLLIAQRLAGVGPDLRGKKVVISLSPTWFFERRQVPYRAYAGNFSRLQAGELLFSAELSYGLKRDFARRMLQYPNPLRQDPLLFFAARKLSDGSPLSWALYELAVPLGKLQNLALRLQDHWESLSYIWSHPLAQPALAQQAAPINWPALIAAARAASARHTSNNPFGFDNQDWRDRYQQESAPLKRTMSDAQFLSGMQRAREWGDLALLLRTLNELGARTLVLSMPIGGRYYDYLGVSARARSSYYGQLRALARRYGAAERDFAEYDQDPAFVLNARGHLLPAGWVYYSRAIDDFAHDRPIE
jgi:D-alanine transfer protein